MKCLTASKLSLLALIVGLTGNACSKLEPTSVDSGVHAARDPSKTSRSSEVSKTFAIPAYGMSCRAADGSSVTIIPNDDQTFVQIELANEDEIVFASNEHEVTLQKKDQESLYTFKGWVEMDQTASLVLRSDESMRGAKFVFNFDSESELGVPRVFDDCDVM